MMMPFSGGSWLFPLLMVVVMIAFVTVIAGVARAALSRPERQNALGGGNDRARAGAEPPLAVLRRRYVRGEIDFAEFERRVDLVIRDEQTPQHELSRGSA